MANLRSIRNKTDEVKTTCALNSVDIFLATETWSKSSDKIMFPGSTTSNRLDKNSVSGIGGGNLVMTKENINALHI